MTTLPRFLLAILLLAAPALASAQIMLPRPGAPKPTPARYNPPAAARPAPRPPRVGGVASGPRQTLRTETFQMSGRIGAMPAIESHRVSGRIVQIVDVRATGWVMTHVQGVGTSTLVLKVFFNGTVTFAPAWGASTVTVTYLVE